MCRIQIARFGRHVPPQRPWRPARSPFPAVFPFPAPFLPSKIPLQSLNCSMVKPQHVFGWVLVTLALACGSAAEKPLPERLFQRTSFTERAFRGQVGPQSVTARLSLRQQALTGELFFEETKVSRQVRGHVSTEGFLRADVLGPSQGADSLAPFSEKKGELRAMQLLPGYIAGSYQSVLGNSTESLLLSDGTDSLLQASLEFRSDTLLWTPWRRIYHCVRSSGDTTATVRMELPALASGPFPEALPHLQGQLGLELAFRRECSCQSLEKAGTRLLERSFGFVENGPEGGRIRVQEWRDGQAGPVLEQRFRYGPGSDRVTFTKASSLP